MDIAWTLSVSFVPDLFVGMRNRPAYLEAAWELFKEDLDLDSLDGRTKQIIALAITTNDAGIYYIAASPYAFRLNALDHATCEKIVSAIRFFKAFDRYLSGVMPDDVAEATELMSHCLHDEYQSYEAARSDQTMPPRKGDQSAASWIGGMLIAISLLWPIAMGIYFLL